MPFPLSSRISEGRRGDPVSSLAVCLTWPAIRKTNRHARRIRRDRFKVKAKAKAKATCASPSGCPESPEACAVCARRRPPAQFAKRTVTPCTAGARGRGDATSRTHSRHAARSARLPARLRLHSMGLGLNLASASRKPCNALSPGKRQSRDRTSQPDRFRPDRGARIQDTHQGARARLDNPLNDRKKPPDPSR